MKTPSKFLVTLAVLAGVVFSLPNLTLAASAKPNLPTNFCKDFNNRSKELTAKLQAKEAEAALAADQKALDLKSKREKRQAELDALRLKAEQKSAEQINKLETVAKTQNQKTAVRQFKTELAKAAGIRNEAVDLAIKIFQKGLDQKLADFQNKLQLALQKYKTSVNAAESKAKTDCLRLDPSAVKQTFSSGMLKAKDNFNSERQLSVLENGLSELKNNREKTVKKANDNFKTQVTASAEKLKKSFK